LLYNQPAVEGISLFLGGERDDAVAMDFVVPPGGRWRISRFVLVGVAQTNPLELDNFLVDLWRDYDGHPDNRHVQGALVISTIGPILEGTPDPCCGGDVSDFNRSVSLSPGFTLDLPPGRYWLASRLSIGKTTNRFSPQFARTVGYPGMLGRDREIWSPIAGTEAENSDFAFAVYGIVVTPADDAASLLTTIAGFGLPSGTFTSLQAKLNAATAALNAGDTNAACTAFQDLINATSAQSGKKLTVAQAAQIIDEATRIRGIIGC
jgi:hypothetical protein